MVSKGSDAVVVYPAYFDARRSLSKGRRVPKKLAVENPTVEAIEQAAKAQGYRTFVDQGAAYSGTPWKKEGRVLVVSGEAKEVLLRKIAARIKR